ncbi:MAG TPA: tetratricopeptide repeat protein [Oculatellaceae cyanobacterium]
MKEKLQEAVSLYKKGDKAQASKLLAEIVRQEPNNSVAWYGLALCLDDPDKKIYCVKKVLSLDPTHTKAQQLLGKLQPAQIAKIETIGDPGLPERSEQPTVEHFQGERSKGIKGPQAQVPDKQTSFQPKYLTAVSGIGIMLGTVFTWAVDESQALGIINQYSGWTDIHGLFTFVVGLVIILLAFLGKTNPGKTNSPISSILAIVTLLANFVWVIGSYCTELGAFFGDPNTVCYEVGRGFGYNLSMFSLFFAFIFGLIPNRKSQTSD